MASPDSGCHAALGRDPKPVLIGIILGFLSGLGVGGGSLLILWLTLALGMEPEKARSINLMFFLSAAILSLIFRRKEKVPVKKLLPAILPGCAAALFFSCMEIPTGLLKKAFGILLIITGIRELWSGRKKEEGP